MIVIPRKIDLIGQKFGRLTVIKEDEPYYTSGGNKKVRWICKCDCDKVISVSSGQLRNGMTKSCGCYQIDRAKEANSKSLVGRKVGRLLVIERAEDYIAKNYLKHQWKCQCDCGNEVVVRGDALISKHIKSCGCLKSERSAETHTKHSLCKTRIYTIYRGMKERCLNLNGERYKDYGGRGITICDEWLGENGVENFAKWAYENGFDENAERGQCTLDRKNNDGDYEPSNCRWVTVKEQSNNTRRSERYEYSGEKHTLPEWADITDLDYHMLKARVKNYGYTIKEAIETPKYTRLSKNKNSNNVNKE